MAFSQKLFTSLHNYTDPATRIGELNRIWYDSANNVFRIQLDKTTLGGTVISAAGSNYTLPVATTTQLGGVRIDGTTIQINNQVISAAQYTLPTASTSVLGGVKVDGSTITISNGIISGTSAYTLPTASTTLLGGIKIDGVSLAYNGQGQLYYTGAGAGGYVLPTATTTVLGGVKIDGSSITINNGVISSTTTPETNVWYVAKIGNDSNDGHRINTAFLTITKALSVAQAGDTVYIQTGTYVEVFPLTVPKGVSVRGAGLREVTINPTTGTKGLNGFLVSGETTVSDLTIGGQLFTVNAGLPGGGTGYAFAFQASASITTRSPYIERVTVMQKGSVTNTPDPYGYAQGDAGRGALVDGSQVLRTSIEPAMLFNECTFFVPNSVGWYLTNGARAELLTTFSYFAAQHIWGVAGTTGYGGSGKTYVALTGKVGTWNVGNSLILYANDHTTVVATGVIEAYNSTTGTYTLTGSVSGYLLNTDRASSFITVAGGAQNSTVQKKFGTASLYLDGTSDYIQVVSNADFAFGTGDFTVELWVYVAVTKSATLFDFRNATNDTALTLYIANNGGLGLTVLNGTRINSTANVASATWTHVAISRTSGVTRMFIGGVLQTATYTDANNYAQRPLHIGSDWNGTTELNGYIDEFRVTKGISRYTTTFTPATQAFAGDTNTVLLLHFDGANGTQTVVDDGITIQDVRSSAGGTATGITRYDRAEFGARTRQIACAMIYGAAGAKADGPDVVLQLMAHNFAYIGSGYDLTNNSATTTSGTEVIELNSGRVFYNSIDQDGNYRVGQYFTVNFATGAISIAGPQYSVTSLTGITFTNGTKTSYIDPTQIYTGQLNFEGNTIITTAGNLNLTPSTGSVVNITGGLTVSGGITGTLVNALTAGTGITFSSGTTYNNSSAITISTTPSSTRLVTTATYLATTSDYYIGVNRTGTVAITLPTPSDGYELVIKDESGTCATYPISIVGTIDNDAGGATLSINNGALHLIYRSGWRII